MTTASTEPQRWTLPGLKPDTRSPDGPWLHQLIHRDTGQLSLQFARLAVNTRSPELRAAVAALVGAPEAEVAASPFALRACAWAASEGFCTVNHELRLPVRWPQGLEPPPEVADPLHATWQEGRLHIGKYRSFLQDEPLVVHNPDHHAKWTPHELMHRVMRFLWHPRLTARELYLGARLNELLPVVLWYGLDEVLRLDNRPFRRETAPFEPEASGERARWWTLPQDALVEESARGVIAFRSALDHYRHEMLAIAEEIGCSRTIEVPHPLLDAASDATAYTIAHLPRLQSPTVRQLLATLHAEGRDRDPDPRSAYMRTRDGLGHLLFGDIVLDVELARSRATARILQDLLHRTAHTLVSERHPFFATLADARRDIDAALDGERPVDLDAWRERLHELCGEAAGTVCAHGGCRPPVNDAQLEQLADGLSSCLPATHALLESKGRLHRVLQQFIDSAHFRRRRVFHVRFLAWLEEAGERPAILELVNFERALLTAPAADASARWLALPAEELDAAGHVEVRAGEGLKLHRYGIDVAALHEALLAGGAGGEEIAALEESAATALLVGNGPAGLVAMALAPAVAQAWEALGDGPAPLGAWMEALEEAVASTGDASGQWPADAEQWMDELLEAGAVAMVPVWPAGDLRP